MNLDTNYNEELLNRRSANGDLSKHLSTLHLPSSSNGKKYQYSPYKNSLSASKQSSSQSSLLIGKPREEYMASSPQRLALQGVGNRVQQQPLSSVTHRPQRPQSSMQQSHHVGKHSSTHRQQSEPQYHSHTMDRHLPKSRSLKSRDHHRIEKYTEFSDAHHQFNNYRGTGTGKSQWLMVSSSSSEESPQGSPKRPLCPLPHSKQESSQHVGSYLPAHQQQWQHHQYSTVQDTQLCRDQRQNDQVQNEPIHMDLYELKQSRDKYLASGSSSQHVSNGLSSSHPRSSRHTFVASRSRAPCTVNSNNSFSLSSSMKCCVGMQPKKKKHHRNKMVITRSRSQSKLSSCTVTTNVAPDQSERGSVRNPHIHALQSRGSRPSPTHSTESCSHAASMHMHTQRGSHNYSSGYSSEVESLRSTMAGEYEGEGSDSDSSDSDFNRATAGARGKSASSVMMKLAKKFSKKNFPIVRDDGDIESIGEREQEVRKMRNQSTSVSSLEG